MREEHEECPFPDEDIELMDKLWDALGRVPQDSERELLLAIERGELYGDVIYLDEHGKPVKVPQQSALDRRKQPPEEK